MRHQNRNIILLDRETKLVLDLFPKHPQGIQHGAISEPSTKEKTSTKQGLSI